MTEPKLNLYNVIHPIVTREIVKYPELHDHETGALTGFITDSLDSTPGTYPPTINTITKFATEYLTRINAAIKSHREAGIPRYLLDGYGFIHKTWPGGGPTQHRYFDMDRLIGRIGFTPPARDKHKLDDIMRDFDRGLYDDR